MRITDPVSYFTGGWEYRREITDGAGRLEGKATGRAIFRQENPGLAWEESGRLEFGGVQTRATRKLLLIPVGDGSPDWKVRFEDGREFHRLTFGDEICEAEHPCGDDLYRGRFDFRNDAEFSTSWRVLGPAKDEWIETTYRKLSAETVNSV